VIAKKQDTKILKSSFIRHAKKLIKKNSKRIINPVADDLEA
jgi:hypothetical protein